MKYDDEEPPFWVTVLKLTAIGVVLVTCTGLLLWWFLESPPMAGPTDLDPSVSRNDWGVVGDNPTRPRR